MKKLLLLLAILALCACDDQSGNEQPAQPVKVALIGDSITTWQGYTPYPNNYQYPKPNKYTDLTSVEQSYWWKLIYEKMPSAELDVNTSYTGTCVQHHDSKGHPGYCFLRRYDDMKDPDVVLINGGTNDSWSYGLPVGSHNFNLALEELDEYQFAQAYDKLIRLIRRDYPKAKIMLIIGDAMQDYPKYYNLVIELATHYNLPYASVRFADRNASTYDRVHPNAKGMQEMADQIWEQLEYDLKRVKR